MTDTTRKDALTALRDAIIANNNKPAIELLSAKADLPEAGSPWSRAASGDLNAAKALHDAVLPGWEYGVTCNSEQPEGPAAFVSRWGGYQNGHDATSDDPARAWLIAILSALIAETTTDGEGA